MLRQAKDVSNILQGAAALVLLWDRFKPSTSTGESTAVGSTWSIGAGAVSTGALLVLCVAAIANVLLSYVGSRREKLKAAQLEKPGLLIRSAVFGTGPDDDIDVTELLQNSARDGLSIQVDVNALRCDPAPGRVKRLEVEYSYKNQSIRKLIRPEYSRLVLPEDKWLQDRLAQEQQRAEQFHKERDTYADASNRAINERNGEFLAAEKLRGELKDARAVIAERDKLIRHTLLVHDQYLAELKKLRSDASETPPGGASSATEAH